MIETLTCSIENQSSTRSILASGGSRSPYWFAWIAAAFLPFMIAAGVTVLVETKKGKLIIDSDLAGVNVTLLNDGVVYDELKIQAGANSTTLLAGKYQIVIDGAADVVMEGDRIEIKRGEIALAKIRTVPKADENSPLDNDAGMVERIYNGHPLSYWLDVLAREEHVESFRDALSAISALNSAENAPTISSLLLKRLPGLSDSFASSKKLIRQGNEKTPDDFSDAIDTSAFRILLRANGRNSYFRRLAEELGSANKKWQQRILNVGVTIYGSPSADELLPIVDWMQTKVFTGANDQETLQLCADFCWERINDSQSKDDVLKERLLTTLTKTDALGSDFWIAPQRLGSVRGYYSGRSVPQLSFAPAKDEVERRALEMLKSEKAELKVQVQSVMLLQHFHGPNFDRFGMNDTREELLQLIRQNLLRLVASPAEMFVVTKVDNNIRYSTSSRALRFGYIQPSGEVRDFGQWVSGSNMVLELLALVDAMKAQSEFSPELVKLYMATAELNEQLHEIINDVPIAALNSDNFTTSPRTSATSEQLIAGIIRFNAYQLLSKETQTELLQIAQRTFQSNTFEGALGEHDADADGKLSVKELSVIAESITRWDTDQSGTIDAQEYAAFFKARSNGLVANRPQPVRAPDVPEDWSKRQIAKYDKNRDGKLSKDEWQTMIIKVDDADANKDGEITVEEFTKFRVRK